MNPILQAQHRPHRVLVVGQSGSGKTTYLTRFVGRVAASCRFLFDPENELGSRMGQETSTSRSLAFAGVSSGWVCYDSSVEFPGDMKAGFAWFSLAAFHASQVMAGRKYFVVDELQKFCPPGTVLDHGAALIFETGRRYGLDVAAVSQAPNLLNARVRNQITELVVLNLADPRARKWVSEFGVSVDPATLAPGQYVARNLLSGVEARGCLWGESKGARKNEGAPARRRAT